MILALVITMLFFSVLVVAMLSTMGSSIFNQLNTASTTKAAYIAKSGYNYLTSQYKSATTELAMNQVFENLNGVNYQLLNNAGSFVLTVQPYYLRYQGTTTYSITNANGLTLSVKFPGAVSLYHSVIGYRQSYGRLHLGRLQAFLLYYCYYRWSE